MASNIVRLVAPMKDTVDTVSSVAPREQAGTFGQLVEAWLADAITRCGKAEVASLRSVTKRIMQALGGRRVEDVDEHAVEAYLRQLADAGLKPRGHARMLRRVLGYGKRQGVVVGEPPADIEVAEGAPVAVQRAHGGKKPRQATPPPPRPAVCSLCGAAQEPAQGATQSQADRPTCPGPKSAQDTGRPKPDWLVEAQAQVGLPQGWLEFRLGDPVFSNAVTE